MALTKKTPETFKALTTIKGLVCGEQTLALTFHNRSPEQFNAFTSDDKNFPMVEGDNSVQQKSRLNAYMVKYLVKSFDDGTEDVFPLTIDGLLDMEEHFPGILFGIIRTYHQCRSVEVQKN